VRVKVFTGMSFVSRVTIFSRISASEGLAIAKNERRIIRMLERVESLIGRWKREVSTNRRSALAESEEMATLHTCKR